MNVLDVIGRFLNMGVEAYNFVSALNCILAQRLVRVICEQRGDPPRELFDGHLLGIADVEDLPVEVAIEVGESARHRPPSRVVEVGGRQGGEGAPPMRPGAMPGRSAME